MVLTMEELRPKFATSKNMFWRVPFSFFLRESGMAVTHSTKPKYFHFKDNIVSWFSTLILVFRYAKPTGAFYGIQNKQNR